MTDLFPGRAGFRQLQEWGFPMGSLRPLPPSSVAFSVIHITGNSNLPSAQSELNWRATDPGLQNSATFFVNRDGSVWQALGDPLRMDPWANGDVRTPDQSNPRIARLVRDGVNANERTLVAIENVGYEPGAPITAAQEKADAAILSYYHAKAGVPVTRETVIGHYQLNSETRKNCPGVNKSLIDRIVALANGDDEMPNAQPATWYPLMGSCALKAGQTYNAFQFKGLEDGTPVLERINDIKYPAQTGARIIARAHWETGKSFDDCYLVSPFAYIPEVGSVDMVWWSRSPRPEPTFINQGGYTASDLDAAKTEGNKAGQVDMKTRATVAVQGLAIK